jgi:hypothetical protein
MTWTKLGAEFGTDPDLLALPRGVRLLHVEALVWCNAHGTDGRIPAHMLARLTDESDPEAAAAMLADCGKWRMTATGWEISAFLADQLSAAEVAERNEQNRIRTNRWRNHREGRHHLCLPEKCDAARDAARNAAGDAARTVPSVPSRSDRNKGLGTDSDADAAPLVERTAGVPETDVAPMSRRDLARLVREADGEPLRNRYRRIFDRSYGHLYSHRPRLVA